jgi:hypothetical protein
MEKAPEALRQMTSPAVAFLKNWVGEIVRQQVPD